jgi:hypothetical protein
VGMSYMLPENEVSAVSTVKPPESLLDRTIGRPRPVWVTLAIAALLVAMMLAASYADDRFASLGETGQLWARLTPIAIIMYVLVVAPWLSREEQLALERFRPIVLLDDEELETALVQASSLKGWKEVLALGAGVTLGAVAVLRGGAGDASGWMLAYTTISAALMNGLLLWAIYVSIFSAHWSSLLLRQPLEIDLFAMEPFEAIGRQSLMLALAFMGGSALALFFVAPIEAISPTFIWASALPAVLVAVSIFFLNMQPTHRVLAAAKVRALQDVRTRLSGAYQTLVERQQMDGDTGSVSSLLSSLLDYEQRLQQSRTWPYNTDMLRTLLLSVLVPIGTVLLRELIS